MFSYWAFILIGNNNTGKTSFQKYLIEELCGHYKNRLERNLISNITHPRMPRGFDELFTMNRSYQETRSEYIDMDNYFLNFFKDAKICIMSSHSDGLSKQDIVEMRNHLKSRAYNVSAVFFSNSFTDDCEEISRDEWSERLWIENPVLPTEEEIKGQLQRKAREFASMLIARASAQ